MGGTKVWLRKVQLCHHYNPLAFEGPVGRVSAVNKGED